MDISDWFDFKQRVTQDMTLVKTVDGRTVTKQVKGSFNWLAWIFSWIYVLATQKYKTAGFVKKAIIPVVALYVADLLVVIILGNTIGFIFNVAGSVWYGLMFDTWFKNQLIANGYHVAHSVQADESGQQNVE